MTGGLDGLPMAAGGGERVLVIAVEDDDEALIAARPPPASVRPSTRKRIAARLGFDPASVRTTGWSAASGSLSVAWARKLSSEKVQRWSSSAASRSADVACTTARQPRPSDFSISVGSTASSGWRWRW